MSSTRNDPPRYGSDRWLTPGVLIAGILTAGVILGIVAAGVTYLAARGVDPDPMIRLVAEVGTLLGVIGGLVLQLVNRSTVTKVDRTTGTLPDVVADRLAERLPAPAEQALLDAREPEYAPEYVPDDTDYYAAPAVPALPPVPDRHRRRRADR